MPGRSLKEIILSDEARNGLNTLEKAHNTRQQIGQRARMILLSVQGESNSAIARMLGVTRNTVSQWRERWLLLEPIPLDELSVEERLEDLPRPGAPPKITAEQRCQLEVLACEAPEKSGRPISQWTGREIADELIKRNIVETISPRHATRLLKRCINSSSSEPLLAKYEKG